MLISQFTAPQPSFRAGCPAAFGKFLLGWCLPVFLTLAPAAQSQATVFNPAKVVIIKADDFRGSTTGWTNFLNSSRNLGIKVSIGVIANGIVGNATTATYMQQQQAMGDVEFWNHGWDHTRSTTDGGVTYTYEFKGTGLASQQTHFSDAQAGLLTATGRDALAFGPGYNAYDAHTVAIMNNTPAMRLFFVNSISTARSLGLAGRIAAVGIIGESGGTGKPVAATFISTYPNGPAGPVSLQFHPNAFAEADRAEYEQIVQFLQGKGYIFMLPAEYIAALDGTAPAGAKIWTGATDANWTTAGNWSPSGAPASGGDVAFDGTGANLGTNLNGTARSLNSLTFTSGQSAPVTITTTNTTPLTLAPTGTTGSWTTLNVAAGSHGFTGTDGGSGALADFRFGGANGTTHVLNIGGSAVFEIKGRIDNNMTNTKTFQKTGTGTLVFSGNNGSSGAWNHSLGSGFQIQQGALRFAAPNAGGFSGNNYIVSSGAALELQGGFTQGLGTGTHTLNGTGISGTGALRSISGNNTIGGTLAGGISLATNSSIGVDADTLTISDDVKGNGTLTKVGAGTLTLSGANTYSGATTVSGGTLNISGTNAGTSYTVNGSGDPALKLSSLNALSVSATISGSNSTASDGSVDFALAGAYTIGSYDKGYITFTASGGPSSLTFTNASAITTAGNAGRTFTNASADLGITFASTLDIGGDSAANVTLNAVGDITVDGGIISTGAGARSLIKNGSGMLTLKGTSTHAGATTVSGGTLALGASNVLPDAQVSLGAATLSVGAGFTETTGRLDVTGAATLHLGDGSSAIAFADNGDLLAWSGTLNLTGTFVSGTSLRFGADATGLTGGQLAKITVNGSGSYALNATGYLVETTAGFASWITGTFPNGTIPEGNWGPNQDFDNDGINNLIEYALAAKDPTLPDAPVGGFDGSSLSFTKRPGTSGLIYAIQESTDLGIGDDWTEVTGGSYVNDGDLISYALPGGSGKNFIRLHVSSN